MPILEEIVLLYFFPLGRQVVSDVFHYKCIFVQNERRFVDQCTANIQLLDNVWSIEFSYLSCYKQREMLTSRFFNGSEQIVLRCVDDVFWEQRGLMQKQVDSNGRKIYD